MPEQSSRAARLLAYGLRVVTLLSAIVVLIWLNGHVDPVRSSVSQPARTPPAGRRSARDAAFRGPCRSPPIEALRGVPKATARPGAGVADKPQQGWDQQGTDDGDVEDDA